MNSILITLYDRPISKKRGKNVGVNKYTKKIYFTSSKAWKKFEKSALEQLLAYKRYRFKGSVYVFYEFFYKGKLSLDIDNAMAGINDVLEAGGIIENDSNIIQGGFKIHKGCDEWRTQITIRKLEHDVPKT